MSSPGVVVGLEHGLVQVRRDADGETVLCRAEGLAKVTDYRVGERVRIGSPIFGRHIAHREGAPQTVTAAAPVRVVSPLVQRAVLAALDAGDRPWTIAARFGLRLDQVHR